MTELGFLLELLLDDVCPKELKIKIKDRIKEVEQQLQPIKAQASRPKATDQAPSTQRILDEAPLQVEHIAQTPAAAQALASRQAAIAQAMSNVPEKGRTSPRKF
jgi:hypothetical protein